MLKQALDGHIHKCVMDRTIKAATKENGQLKLWMDNGQAFRIAWVDQNGEPVEGEPVLAGIDCQVWLGV